MRQFFITVFGVVVGIIAFFFLILLFLFGIGLVGALSDSMKPKPAQVLSFDMRMALPDQGMGDTLFASSTGVVDIARALDAAKTDDRIKGLFIRADRFGLTPASAEELREAILNFKSSGKFVVAHAQGFESPSLFPYMTVAGADELWMQDTTGFAVAGIHSETEFFGGVMEKIDAQPQFEQFYEYKNAVNTYTETGFTEPHKEAMTSFLTSLYDTAISRIAEDREMSVAAVTQFLNASPHSAEAAMEAGLVDKMGFLEDAKRYVKKKAGSDKTILLNVSDYIIPSNFGAPTIAYIGGEGAVVNGSSSTGGPFGGAVTMGGDTLAKAFDNATKDKNVKAIVFRVSSPGGSPSASDQILAAAERAQDAGKPVIISMGQYAASGGYYVSATADKIVALPSTITGSIGVFGGKVALEDSFAKVGYNIEAVTIGGEYAGAFSPDTPFTESQREGFRGQLAEIYDDFIARVAKGREMSEDDVKEIAKGRVWTGEQAKERGLVDELGGFLKAIEVAKDMADIDADTKIRVKRFPPIPTPGEQLQQLLSGAEQTQANIALLNEVVALPEVQAAIRAHQATRKQEALKAHLPFVE